MLGARLYGTSWLERALELFERAVDDSERETFLLEEREGSMLQGVAIYGWVGGAVGTGRLHLVVPVAELPDAFARGVALCRRAAERLRDLGARLVVAELPDDPAVAWMAEMLRGAGWTEEGRIPDFFRDGVALLLLRRDTA